MAKTPRVPGEPEQADTSDELQAAAADAADDPSLEPTADDERVQQLLEVVERLSDRVGDLEAVVEGLAKRIGNGHSNALPVPEAAFAPSQEEALAQANQLGRAVLSRDGWVAPSRPAAIPPMMQVGGPR